MLVALAITLLMMAAVVTVFANVTQSVTRRRATLEMSSQLRTVREQLMRDLETATCYPDPARTEEQSDGYFEVIEGPQNDYYPSVYLWDGDADGEPDPVVSDARPGIDTTLSFLPGSTLGGDQPGEDGRGAAIGSLFPLEEEQPTDGRGLGDADDILMFTSRSENEPFVGRIPLRDLDGTNDRAAPRRPFSEWESEQYESDEAEIVWFAFENPAERRDAQTFAFGEPGFRTIHRRALLIAPELNYRFVVTPGDFGLDPLAANTVVTGPGVVRVLRPEVDRSDVSEALAALVAFQDRYDLSVRVEWDPTLPRTGANLGRWVIRANSTKDLARREHRYEHHGYQRLPNGLAASSEWNPVTNQPLITNRYYPFALATGGFYTNSQADFELEFLLDGELDPVGDSADFEAVTDPVDNRFVVAYQPNPAETDDQILATDRSYAARPFVRSLPSTASNHHATARAVLNEDGNVVHVVRGLAPLGGARRGEDVMMIDALAFDVKVYDPGAPVYGLYSGNDPADPFPEPDRVLTPNEPLWAEAFAEDVNETGNGGWPDANPPQNALVGDLNAVTFGPGDEYRFLRRGAYVDLGYGETHLQVGGSANRGRILAEHRFAPRLDSANNYPAFPTFATMWYFGNGMFQRPCPIIDPAVNPTNEQAWNAVVLGTSLYRTYDSWTDYYEYNGVNEDLDDERGFFDIVGDQFLPVIDEGRDGFASTAVDVDGQTIKGVDNASERETRPPYERPLRGVQVKIGVYERDSRQVRETIVRESLLPE